jgi:hypothetical protein
VAAFDAAEISQAVRELAARHEALHEKLSRAIGPVADYGSMTSPELAAYGLKKLGVEVPDAAADPIVVALENFLHGRAGREGGMGAGMDAGDDNFVSRYINT